MAVSLSGMTLYTNNDNETNWGGTDGPDAYNVAIQGTNSESWLVSKNNSETGTLTLTPGTAPNTTRGLFIFWMKSDLNYYYTDIRAELQSTASNYKQFICATSSAPDISGDFHAIALDYVNKGTATGTYAPASHTVTRIIVDNSSSGNIRSVTNNWIDAMYFGVGHTISGTTTGDALFAEAAAVDQNGTNEYGILNNYNGIIYSQGDLDLSGTALVSDSETLVFVDTTNGYDTYEFDATGTVTLTNTAVIAAGTIDYNFDSSSSTSFTMSGGGMSGFLTITFKSADSVSGVVFQSGGTTTVPNTLTNCTFNTCGAITLTGTLTGCIIDSNTAASAVLASTPTVASQVSDTTFTSDGTGNGLEIGGTASNITLTDIDFSGYSTTVDADKPIYVNIATGSMTINISGGTGVTASSHVRTAGCTVTVVADVTVTFTGMKDNTEVRVYKTSDDSVVDGIEDVTAGTPNNRSFAWSAPATTDVYYVIHSTQYESIRVEGYIVPASAAFIPIQQRLDRNYNNPV